MAFSSYEFIFLFLPISLIGYFLLGRIKKQMYQKLWLIAASLFFYAYVTPGHLLILIPSVLINYAAVYYLSIDGTGEKKRKTVFVLLTIFNILLLGYFKYCNFFLDTFSSVFSLSITFRQTVIPIAISFFTFQQIQYTLSVYRREQRCGQFIDYALFVVFFPQLLSGPIVTYDEMMPSFESQENRHVNSDNLASGFYLFVLGLFKKLVIADTLATYVSNGYGSIATLTRSAAWLTVILYMVQLYFDFSGYSDMAMGVGKMFNVNIPVNFDSPFKSKSINEFWRRWHITLGRALRVCVYFPLGGSRCSKPRIYFNLFITFLISGIWHGASWTFVVWGVLQAVVMILERIFAGFLEKIPGFIRIFFTFIIASLMFVFFRSADFTQASEMFRAMFIGIPGAVSGVADLAIDGLIGFPATVNIAYMCIITAILGFIIFFTKNSTEIYKRMKFNAKYSAAAVILFAICVFHLSRESVFIYFNF